MTEPVVVLAGAPAWAETAATLLGQQGFALRRYETLENSIARLADDHAALIVVGGDGPDWRLWITTPKTSPATRRIPVVLVAEGEAVRREALGAGADFVLSPGELPERLPALAAEYARVPDSAQMEALACQCGEPLPPLAAQGVKKFNAGDYYAQHDLFEAQWMAEPGPVRDLYRAILQIGIAYYQIGRGNHRGALKMLLRSVQWLNLLPDVCQGVDVAQLRADSSRVRAALERMNPADHFSFDQSLLKPIRLVGPGEG